MPDRRFSSLLIKILPDFGGFAGIRPKFSGDVKKNRLLLFFFNFLKKFFYFLNLLKVVLRS